MSPIISPERNRVLAEIHDERDRQDAKWGEQNHPDGTGPDVYFLGYPLPTLRDIVRQGVDQAAASEMSSWLGILLEEVFESGAEDDPAKLRAELIQAAAVAVSWVEAIDRRTSVN